MKTLTDVKRRAVKGATMIMEYGPAALGKANPLIGLPRKIITVQTTAIQFEPHAPGKQGSWLYWPKASECSVEGDTFTTFEASDGPGVRFKYRFVEEDKPTTP